MPPSRAGSACARRRHGGRPGNHGARGRAAGRTGAPARRARLRGRRCRARRTRAPGRRRRGSPAGDDMALAAVIFDMDGLLVDTERLQFGASDLVLRDLRGVALPREVMVALVGRRSDECWAYMRELYGLTESI